MNKVTVSDTGPLLHLTEIGHTSLLKLFPQINITIQVKIELEQIGVLGHITNSLSDQLIVENISSSEIASQMQILSTFRIQFTDVSVAVLAAKHLPDIVLTDDLELRKVLESRGHFVTGSVGILFRAFKEKQITREGLVGLLDRLFTGSTLYLSREFRKYVWNLLGNLAP